MMPETLSHNRLVRKADQAFRRYLLHTWGAPFPIDCFTCGVGLVGDQIKIGHILSRRFFATRWMVSNAKPQCSHCNDHLDGNRIKDLIDPELLARLCEVAYDPDFRLSDFYIREIISQYEELR